MKLAKMGTLNEINYGSIPQSLSLLHDKRLVTSKKIVLNPDDPFSIYEPVDGWCLGHAMSGSVYQCMYGRLVAGQSRMLLCL
jgi:hypothetical protein